MKTLSFIICFFFFGWMANGQCTFTYNISVNHPTCYGFNDGGITINASGGNGMLTFEITDTNGTILNTGGTGISNNLPGGWYYVSITDQTPCTELDSVFLINPPQLDVDLTLTHNNLCFTDSAGSAQVDSVYNAQGNYNQVAYFWNPSGTGGQGIGANTQSNLPTGSYVLTINDEFGCSRVFDFSITGPPELVFDEFGFDPCSDTTSGVIWMAASGGTAGYSYLWTSLCDSSNVTNTTWGGLAPCCYEATVTDNNGCILKDTICLSCLSLPEAKFNLEIYPNPNNGSFTIFSDHNGMALLNIYDFDGRLIFQEKMNQTKKVISLDQPAGIYWILIATETGVARNRILIE